MACQDDAFGAGGMSFDLLHDHQTIHIRQFQVNKRCGGGAFPCLIHGCLPLIRAFRNKALQKENIGERPREIRIIIHQKYERSGDHGSFHLPFKEVSCKSLPACN